MAQSIPLWKQRQIWTILVALVALAFWVVGLGAGWRGWVLTPFDQGIVAHAQGFGVEAYIWWIPATIISLTAVMMAIGISVVRHLVDGPTRALPELERFEPLEPLEPLETLEAAGPALDAGTDPASGTTTEDIGGADRTDRLDITSEAGSTSEVAGGAEDATETGDATEAETDSTEPEAPDVSASGLPGDAPNDDPDGGSTLR